MPITRSYKENSRMVITTSQCSELRNFGAISSKERLTRWTLQSAWRWSNLQELWTMESILIVGLTRAVTGQLPQKQQSEIGLLWMISRSPKNTWCDYCKGRWGTERKTVTIPETGKSAIVPQDAVWQITSKRHGKLIVRHYCQSCADYVQAWPDGSTWTLKEQLDYAKGLQNINVQPK